MADIGSKTIKMGLALAKLDPTFGYSFSVNPMFLKGLKETKEQRKARRDAIATEYRIKSLMGLFNTTTVKDLRKVVYSQSEAESENKERTDKEEQGNIKKGIQGAFGGSTLRVLTKIFGFKYGITGAIEAAKFFGYKNAIQTSLHARTLTQAAIASGATTGEISTMGNVLRQFGGSIKDAIGFRTAINNLLSGAKYGEDLGAWGDAARKFGMNLTGGGEGGLPTYDELMEELANLIQRKAQEGPGELSYAAKVLQVPTSLVMALQDGYEAYKERERYAAESDPYIRNAESMEKLAESTSKLGIEFDNLLANVANTDFVKGIIDAISRGFHEYNKIAVNTSLVRELYQKAGGNDERFLSLLKEAGVESYDVAAPFATTVLSLGGKGTYDALSKAHDLLDKDFKSIISDLDEATLALQFLVKETEEELKYPLEDLVPYDYDDDEDGWNFRRLYYKDRETSILPVSNEINISGNMILNEGAKKQIEDIISAPQSWSWMGLDNIILPVR